MPTLRITFSGLCTFAFKDRPLKGEGDPPKEVAVLLQRLTRSRLLTNVANARTEILDQHFPLLEFDVQTRDKASSRKADVHFKPDLNGEMTKGLCYLNGEDLTILLDGREMRPDFLDFSRHRPDNPDAIELSQDDQDSLWWMATLQDVFPGNPAINPKILETSPGSNQPVLARIRLSEGTLRTLDLTDSPCTIVGPSSSSFRQRVATSFEFAIEFQEKVEIKMVANCNGKNGTKMLRFCAPEQGDLKLGIMNMEVDRIMGADPASGPRAESDFSVYAEVLQDKVQGIVPFLRQTSPGSPAGNAASTCVPAGH